MAIINDFNHFESLENVESVPVDSKAGLLNGLKMIFYKFFKRELWTKLWNSERMSPRSNLPHLRFIGAGLRRSCDFPLSIF
jgi:hypothetical protein